MNEHKAAILSTRPLANNTMIKAADLNILIDTESFIETKNIIDPIISQRIKQFAAQNIEVAFTSMNAAEGVIACLQYHEVNPEWTIYSMGGTTHTIIKDYFLDSEIIATANNSTQLAESIVEDEVDEVIFFCGNQRREELPLLLSENNIKVNEVVVYETIETPVKIEKTYNGILFFSPSAVRSFFSINKVGAETVLFAIGTTTAHALKKESSNKVFVGEYPNKEYLAERAIEFFK
jgi:uroporphyrinogen-III synthase